MWDNSTYPSSEDIYFGAVWLLCWTHSRQMVWPFRLHQTHLAADMSSCTFFQSSQKVFFFQPGNYLHQIIYFHFLNFCATLPSWCSAHVSRDGLHLNAVHHRSGSSSIAASSSSPLSASSSSSTSPSSSAAESLISFSLHYHHRQHHCTLHLKGLGFPWLVIYYHHCRRYHHHQRYHPHQHHCQ